MHWLLLLLLDPVLVWKAITTDPSESMPIWAKYPTQSHKSSILLSNMTIGKTWKGSLGVILSIGHALSFVAATGSSAMEGHHHDNAWPILKINPKHPFQVFSIVILDRRMLELCQCVGYLAHMSINSGGSVVVAFHTSTRSSSSKYRQCMAYSR
jgi:hypothetical protein